MHKNDSAGNLVRQRIDAIVDAREKVESMASVNLAKEKNIANKKSEKRQRKWNFFKNKTNEQRGRVGGNEADGDKKRTRRIFAAIYIALGVVIVGLAIAIVVVNVTRGDGSEETFVNSVISEESISDSVAKCTSFEDIGEVSDCLKNTVIEYQDNISQKMAEKIDELANSGNYNENDLNTGEFSYIEDGEDANTKLIEMVYGQVIEKYVNENKDLDAAYLLVDQVNEWVMSDECCKAKQILESEMVKNLSASARVVFYSRTIGAIMPCGYNDQIESWENLLMEAKIKASEEYAESQN